MGIHSGKKGPAGRERLRGGRYVTILLLLGTVVIAAWAGNSAQLQPGSATPSGRNRKAERSPSVETYQLSRERYQKAVSYARKEYALYFVSVAWGILTLLVLLRIAAVAGLRHAAERVSGKPWIQGLIFVPSLMLLLALLHLPISVYAHRLSLRYEQSIQGWGSWFWDWTKGELLSLGLGYVVAVILVSVIRFKPRTWWLYFWYAVVPLALFLFFLSPWLVDPLFNKFTPLQAKYPELVAAIGQLTERAGVPIPAERMSLMEASAKTNQINAYVTGVGASKRVVVWDTTIEKMQPDEVMVVVGHELGHYVLGHVWKGFLFFTGGLLVGLYVAYLALNAMLRLWGNRWGVRGQGDWAALAVLLLILRVMEFVGSPAGNAFSRMEEHAADVYGLEVTHGIVPNSQQVAAQAFQRMGEIDLADPNPPKFITLWLYSHPPLGERLKFAHNYDPWSNGQEPKYVK